MHEAVGLPNVASISITQPQSDNVSYGNYGLCVGVGGCLNKLEFIVIVRLSSTQRRNRSIVVIRRTGERGARYRRNAAIAA